MLAGRLKNLGLISYTVTKTSLQFQSVLTGCGDKPSFCCMVAARRWEVKFTSELFMMLSLMEWSHTSQTPLCFRGLYGVNFTAVWRFLLGARELITVSVGKGTKAGGCAEHYCWQHWCLSLGNIVCCEVEISASGWSIVQRSFKPGVVCQMCVWSGSPLGQGHEPASGQSATGKYIYIYTVHARRYLTKFSRLSVLAPGIFTPLSDCET